MPAADSSRARSRLRAWERDERLATLGFSSYSAYISSPKWRAVRRRYQEQHPWICNICGFDDALELHHRTYDRVGEERLEDLMSLCAECHDMVHALERRGDADLDFEGVINTGRALRNRAETSARVNAIQTERATDLEALKAVLETLPLDERIRRALKAADRTGRSHVRDQRRIIARKMEHGEATREFVVRRIRAMEAVAYGFRA